jgi:uncharacterized protein
MSQPTEAASPAAAPEVVIAPMPLGELDRWLRGRTQPRPVAKNVAMFDGYITAIVAGPVSLPPLEWICPLLGVAPDAFNDGSTVEFAAIGAVAERHNAISNTLPEAPGRFVPIFGRTASGAVDVAPWCQGFHAAMQLRRKAWRRLWPTGRPANPWLLPILSHCTDAAGRPVPGAPPPGPRAEQARFEAEWTIPFDVEAMRQFWMPTRFKTKS